MSDFLVEMRDVRIEGRSDETWMPIINGVDLTLKKGEVLGLIGESGAGKSTSADKPSRRAALSSPPAHRPWCRPYRAWTMCPT